MSIAFDHRENGTAEEAWREAEPWREARELDLDAPRVIVLAAHPDDETLGAGGLVATAARAGAEVTVVVVTDGEGSHPESSDPDLVARLRREELVRAVNRLAPHARVLFLGVPDGGVREHRDQVAEAVGAVVRMGGGERALVAAPWWGDGHRDHRVLGEIALALAGAGVHVVGYPIWMWHWAQPDEVDASRWRVLRLEPDAARAKADAVAEHVSQLHPRATAPEDGPMLHANTLAHFSRPLEVFIEPEEPRGPAIDFEAFHARHADPWGLESHWYEARKRALLMAALPRERFRRALELGCASGITTAPLAERADAVLAVDSSATALRRALRRGLPATVEWARLDLPEQWPEGRFDLVVLSEIAYYWSPERLAHALDRIDTGADEDAVLVACHWRHPIDGAPSTGDAVHAAIAARPEWRRAAGHLEEDFVLEVFLRPDAPSVAQAEGLTS